MTERIADEILSLPMFPELSDDQIDQVVDGLEFVYANRMATGVYAAS